MLTALFTIRVQLRVQPQRAFSSSTSILLCYALGKKTQEGCGPVFFLVLQKPEILIFFLKRYPKCRKIPEFPEFFVPQTQNIHDMSSSELRFPPNPEFPDFLKTQKPDFRENTRKKHWCHPHKPNSVSHITTLTIWFVHVRMNTVHSSKSAKRSEVDNCHSVWCIIMSRNFKVVLWHWQESVVPYIMT